MVRNAGEPAPAGAIALTVTRAAPPSSSVFSASLNLPISALVSTSLELTVAQDVIFAVTIGGAAVSGSGQAVSVRPAAVHAPSAQFTLAAAQIVAGGTLQMSAQARDEFGNFLTTGGDLFQCASNAVDIFASAESQTFGASVEACKFSEQFALRACRVGRTARLQYVMPHTAPGWPH